MQQEDLLIIQKGNSYRKKLQIEIQHKNKFHITKIESINENSELPVYEISKN